MFSPKEELILGTIGAFLFLFRITDNTYRYPIFMFILGLFLSQGAYLFFESLLPAQIIWAVSASGLLIFYLMRFGARQKSIVDFAKVVGIIMLIIYPMPFYTIVSVGEWSGWAVINAMTFYFLGTIYLYDRFLLKPLVMKKRYLLILVVQTILIGFFWLYGFVQKVAAEENMDFANEQRKISKQLNLENEKLKEVIKNCN